MASKARRLGAAVGVAVTAGGALLAVARAEPIPAPLLPAPVSKPADLPAVPTLPPAGVTPPAPTLPTIPPAPKVGELTSRPTAPAAGKAAPGPVVLPVLPTITPSKPIVDIAPPPRPGLPAPGLPTPARPSAEVAPPARPAQTHETPLPAPPAGPDSRLRPGESGLNLKPGGPPAAPPASPTPGDAPVLTPNKLLLSATLGAALAGNPAPANGQTPGSDPKSNTESKTGTDPKSGTETVKKDDLADLKATLNGIKDDITKLKATTKDADEAVFGKKDGKGTGVDAGLLARFAKMEDDLKRFEETLKRIEERLNQMAKTTTSGFGPTAPAKSSVRIVNDYQTDMTLILNRASHRLAPGEIKTIEIPSGSYTYELLVPGGQPVTSTLKDGETVTLRIK